MTKVKRSFFERLTGAKKIEMDMSAQDISIPTFSREEDDSREEITLMEPESSGITSPDSNWSSDSEGQLTIDVYQTETEIVIKSTIAGVKPEDLDVSINNEMITIKGSRRNEEEVPQENYYYQECYWGPFSRSVVLPVDILPDRVEASLKNGILTIKLPKADITKTKKIQVRGF